jgi:AcrR family transcriptional regulator
MHATDRLPLTRERIVVAAIEFADEHGIEALSMRKLGAALGVEAMSLYNHVANKDDVLDAMLEHALVEIALPDESWPWDRQLRMLAEEFRAAGLRHPGILPLFGTRGIASVAGLAPLERAYGILRSTGLDPDDALDAFVSAASFVLGYLITERGGFRDVAAGRTVDVATIDPAEHPRLIEMGLALANHDGDREFTFGVDLLIAGVRRRLDERDVDERCR